MSISDNSNSSQNYVDLIDLIKQIWKDKFYILFIVLLFLAFAIYQLNNATYTYDIYLKVTPSKQMSVSSPRRGADKMRTNAHTCKMSESCV